MDPKYTVFVYDQTGTPHAHGPARASLAQATSVAKTLTKRLGWDCAVSTEVPPSVPVQDRRPTATQAACSPVWKDATLALAWEASKR